jgi:hypothetical protein
MATRLWLSGAVAPPIALGEAMAAMVGSNFGANLSCERIGRFEWIYIYDTYMILILSYMMICKAKGSKPAGVACTMLLRSRWSCSFARIDLNCKEDLK